MGRSLITLVARCIWTHTSSTFQSFGLSREFSILVAAQFAVTRCPGMASPLDSSLKCIVLFPFVPVFVLLDADHPSTLTFQ